MENKIVVLITGCSTGIGRELCNILSDKDCIVAATARNVETIMDLPSALKLSLDVTKKETIYSAVEEVISKFGKIDILVNNAGYSIRGALEEINVESTKTMFDVNVFGIINTMQAVLPHMRKRRSGKIINIGSISGKFVQPINGAYCSSKFAVEALSDAVRLELYDYNIQSTVVEPGPMKTNFFVTLEDNSNNLMSNSTSCYAHFYESDTKYRKIQKRTDTKEAADIICNIILKKRLKARYKVAVPFAYKLITYLPDFIREYLMRRR